MTDAVIGVQVTLIFNNKYNERTGIGVRGVIVDENDYFITLLFDNKKTKYSKRIIRAII